MLAEQVRAIVKPQMRVLDLGCGTGRLGQLIAGQLGAGANITGVDLSEPMLRQAAAGGAYKLLVQQDIVHFLLEGGDRFDLVLMASVLPFFGSLKGLMRPIAARQGPNAYLAFTFDSGDALPIQLRHTARFVHSEAHVRSVLLDCRYRVQHCEYFQGRIERGDGVQSAVVVAHR
jgi:predicted TPR repeat methyltransferase